MKILFIILGVLFILSFIWIGNIAQQVARVKKISDIMVEILQRR